MRKLFQGFVAAAVLVTGMAAMAPAPAVAQSFQIEVGPRGVQVNQGRGYVDRRYDPYCRAAFCGEALRGDRRWEDRRDHRRWDNRRHDRRWDDRRGGRGGPHAGRISRESVARCAQRYRSYDPRTHTYVVNRFGDRAVCRL